MPSLLICEYITPFLYKFAIMKIKRTFTLCGIAVMLCICASAQQKWTLGQCISYARENNLQVKQMELGEQQAQNNVLAARMEYLPSVNASMGHNMSWGRSVNLNDLEIVENKLSQSSSMNLSASLPLFEGLRKQNNLKSNIKQLEIARANTDELRDNISIAIVRGYLQVLLCKELEKCAIESSKNVEKQAETTQALVDAGTQTLSSLLEVKSQLASEKLQMVTASNNTRTALLELSQLLNLPDSIVFDIEIPQDTTVPAAMNEESIDTIFNIASSLPRIQKAELALEQSILQHKIQKGAALPTLSFSAGYGTYYSDNQKTAFFTQFDNNRNPSMGFSLSIPIFNNWRNNTAIKNARNNVKSAQLGVEISKQELKKEIQMAYNEAINSYGKYTAAAENLNAAMESFKFTQQKFNLGMLNGTDFSAAKTSLTKAESEYIQCKYQYMFQLKILDYYRNIPLTL